MITTRHLVRALVCLLVVGAAIPVACGGLFDHRNEVHRRYNNRLQRQQRKERRIERPVVDPSYHITNGYYSTRWRRFPGAAYGQQQTDVVIDVEVIDEEKAMPLILKKSDQKRSYEVKVEKKVIVAPGSDAKPQGSNKAAPSVILKKKSARKPPAKDSKRTQPAPAPAQRKKSIDKRSKNDRKPKSDRKPTSAGIRVQPAPVNPLQAVPGRPITITSPQPAKALIDITATKDAPAPPADAPLPAEPFAAPKTTKSGDAKATRPSGVTPTARPEITFEIQEAPTFVVPSSRRQAESSSDAVRK